MAFRKDTVRAAIFTPTTLELVVSICRTSFCNMDFCYIIISSTTRVKQESVVVCAKLPKDTCYGLGFSDHARATLPQANDGCQLSHSGDD